MAVSQVVVCRGAENARSGIAGDLNFATFALRFGGRGDVRKEDVGLMKSGKQRQREKVLII